jgi:hypothetical protein
MNKTNKIISAIVILIIVGGASFYAGTIYSKQSSPATSGVNGSPSGFAGRSGRTGGAGGGFISGTIISKDNSSITLQLPSSTGGSKVIFYSSATQIGKMTTGTSDDLTTGTNVSITGTTNSDGSVTAQSIQIRPAQQNNPGAPSQIPAQ